MSSDPSLLIYLPVAAKLGPRAPSAAGPIEETVYGPPSGRNSRIDSPAAANDGLRYAAMAKVPSKEA